MRQFLIFTLLFLSTIHLYSQTIDVTIDWNNSVRAIPEYAYGVNSPANFIPSYSNDPTFMRNLKLITQKKGFVRLHGWGMIDKNSPESWLSNGKWNSAKIKQAILPLQQQAYKVMINIPSGSLGEDDYQNPQKFAQLCAELVKIVNIDHQLGIEYWEIPNEREQGFVNPGLTVNQMATLIKTASQAMKAIDPKIKVGGAATAWINIDYLTQLVQATLPNIDFITCHTYAGDCTNSLQKIYDNAQFAVADLKTLRQNINSITGSNYLPIFLTEYNLSYQGCDNIQSTKGAIYDAIIMTESIKSGIDGTCYWAIAPYSDMSIINGDHLDENAYLFKTLNTYFQGNITKNTTSDGSKILIYSTIDQNSDNYSFSLINRTSVSQNIKIKMLGISPNNLDRYVWNGHNNYLTEATNWSNLDNGNISVSPYSVNLFTGKLSALSIEDNEDRNELVLHPNPSNGIIHLSSHNSIKTFQVFSSLGTMLKSGEIESNRIDLTAFLSGIYFIRVINEEGTISTFKVILK